MIDTIKSETKSTIYKCCERYAKSKEVSIESVQLILGADGNGVTYWVCENYVPKLQMDILEVLGVKIDFSGGIKSKLAPQFILQSLIRFAQQYKIEMEKTMVMCIPSKNEKGKPDVLLYLYKGSQYLETITFENLFREEDLQSFMQ